MQSDFHTLTHGVSHCEGVCVFSWSWLLSTSLSLTLILSAKLLDGSISFFPSAPIKNVFQPVSFTCVGLTHLRCWVPAVQSPDPGPSYTGPKSSLIRGCSLAALCCWRCWVCPNYRQDCCGTGQPVLRAFWIYLKKIIIIIITYACQVFIIYLLYFAELWVVLWFDAGLLKTLSSQVLTK